MCGFFVVCVCVLFVCCVCESVIFFFVLRTLEIPFCEWSILALPSHAMCVCACVLFGALLAALILIVAQSKYLTCISLVYLAEDSVYHALVRFLPFSLKAKALQALGPCDTVEIPVDTVCWSIPSFCPRSVLLPLFCAFASTDTLRIALVVLSPCTRADCRRMYTSFAPRPTISVGASTRPPSLSWQGGARFHGVLMSVFGLCGPVAQACTVYTALRPLWGDFPT